MPNRSSVTRTSPKKSRDSRTIRFWSKPVLQYSRVRTKPRNRSCRCSSNSVPNRVNRLSRNPPLPTPADKAGVQTAFALFGHQTMRLRWARRLFLCSGIHQAISQTGNPDGGTSIGLADHACPSIRIQYRIVMAGSTAHHSATRTVSASILMTTYVDKQIGLFGLK